MAPLDLTMLPSIETTTTAASSLRSSLLPDATLLSNLRLFRDRMAQYEDAPPPPPDRFHQLSDTIQSYIQSQGEGPVTPRSSASSVDKAATDRLPPTKSIQFENDSLRSNFQDLLQKEAPRPARSPLRNVRLYTPTIDDQYADAAVGTFQYFMRPLAELQKEATAPPKGKYARMQHAAEEKARRDRINMLSESLKKPSPTRNRSLLLSNASGSGASSKSKPPLVDKSLELARSIRDSSLASSKSSGEVLMKSIDKRRPDPKGRGRRQLDALLSNAELIRLWRESQQGKVV